MLVDTLDLTPEEELAHIRLCDWVWSQDRWPAAAHKVTMQVARVAAASWPRVLRSLRLKGWQVNRGLLYHGGVHRTLREAKDAHASAVARGRKGGQSRTPPSPAQAQLQHQQPH